jgi:hypothetical protein
MCFFAHAVACSSGNDEAVAELDSIVERGLSACLLNPLSVTRANFFAVRAFCRDSLY